MSYQTIFSERKNKKTPSKRINKIFLSHEKLAEVDGSMNVIIVAKDW